MLIPKKHLNFSQSLLGLGSYLIEELKTPKTIDDLWKKYQFDFKSGNYFAKHSFDNLILTIVFLFSIGVIEEKQGIISKCV
ncbi:MAG: ABC-three component system middle component 6 [Alphaproteobacteria bacterium]